MTQSHAVTYHNCSYWVIVNSKERKPAAGCNHDTPPRGVMQQMTGHWQNTHSKHTHTHTHTHGVPGGQHKTRWLWPCSSFFCLVHINLHIPPSFTPIHQHCSLWPVSDVTCTACQNPSLQQGRGRETDRKREKERKTEGEKQTERERKRIENKLVKEEQRGGEQRERLSDGREHEHVVWFLACSPNLVFLKCCYLTLM